jgi:hypothetical protein
MNQEIKKKRVRKLSRYLLVIAIIWAFPTSAIGAGPLKLSSDVLKTGTIKEGVTVKKRVTLENTGNKEIVIKNISTS